MEVAERLTVLPPTLGSGWLQWSRDLEVAESDPTGHRVAESLGLQWSRDLEVAERPRRFLQSEMNSSGLQWSRDLEVAESSLSPVLEISFPALQWSRDLEVAESNQCQAAGVPFLLLQWSRDLEVAESYKSFTSLSGSQHGFNGAATWKSRKVRPGRSKTLDSVASMEPRLGSRGKKVPPVVRRAA